MNCFDFAYVCALCLLWCCVMVHPMYVRSFTFKAPLIFSLTLILHKCCIFTGIQYLSPWKARVRHMQKWTKMIRTQSATGGDHSKSSKPSYRPKSLPPNSIYDICTRACTPMYPLDWRLEITCTVQTFGQLRKSQFSPFCLLV